MKGSALSEEHKGRWRWMAGVKWSGVGEHLGGDGFHQLTVGFLLKKLLLARILLESISARLADMAGATWVPHKGVKQSVNSVCVASLLTNSYSSRQS